MICPAQRQAESQLSACLRKEVVPEHLNWDNIAAAGEQELQLLYVI